MKLKIHAGAHARVQCPVRIVWTEREAPQSLAVNGQPVAVQRDGDSLVFVPLPLEAGATAVYEPQPGGVETGGVRLEDRGDRITVESDGAEFTSYWYRDVPARPYFWPLLAPGEVPITRAYPMERVAGETQDHPHHRSLYFAHGEVNTVDNWSEMPGHGHTIHKSLDELVSGPVYGRFASTSDWTDKDGLKILTQQATLTFWRGDDQRRMMDVDLRLMAAGNDVLFGDTKEGGILSVRVASAMDVERRLGGRIENCYGGIDEAETWGRAAHWCDYSGIIDGQRYGIAVMDHPRSFRYPTYWHVRNYGLMTANPFGLAAYTAKSDEVKEGSHLLRTGESLRFSYRVLIHRGDATEADVRQHYLDFVSPPQVETFTV